jgi:YecR-like lipoprotein
MHSRGRIVKNLFIGVALISLAACEVAKTPVATGGSKSDGLVEMSYDVGGLEIAKVDWSTAQISAAKRCSVWGYRNAEPFEGARTQCQSFDGYGGYNYATVTRTYQCTG